MFEGNRDAQGNCEEETKSRGRARQSAPNFLRVGLGWGRGGVRFSKRTRFRESRWAEETDFFIERDFLKSDCQTIKRKLSTKEFLFCFIENLNYNLKASGVRKKVNLEFWHVSKKHWKFHKIFATSQNFVQFRNCKLKHFPRSQGGVKTRPQVRKLHVLRDHSQNHSQTIEINIDCSISTQIEIF